MSVSLKYFILFFVITLVCGDTDLYLTVVSTLENSNYLSNTQLDNIALPQKNVILSATIPQSISNPSFDSNKMFTIEQWPNANKYSIFSLYSTNYPEIQSSNLTDTFCNLIQTTYFNSTMDDWFVLSSTKNNCSLSNCFSCFNVYRVDYYTGAVRFLFESPLNNIPAQPLSWMTFDTEARVFIFYLPNFDLELPLANFVTQSMDGSTQQSEETTEFVFYSIDWISENLVIGPCVDREKNFGLCTADYTTAETLQVIRLSPSYNPQLTATYLSKDKSLFVFAGQQDASKLEQIQIYVVNITTMQLIYSLPYTLKDFYHLAGLYISTDLPDIIVPTFSTISSVVESSLSNSIDPSELSLSALLFAVILSAIAIIVGLLLVSCYFYFRREEQPAPGFQLLSSESL